MNIGGITAATGAATTANAAAAEAQRQYEEEEELTPYRQDDLEGEWEFKFLRSMTGAFGKREHLRRALEDEALCGWVLVEKFDNNRLRLKRRVGVHDDEFNPDIDPYRTNYGTSDTRFLIAGLALTFGAMAVGAGVLAFALGG